MLKLLATVACLALLGPSATAARHPTICGPRLALVRALNDLGEVKLAKGFSAIQTDLKVLELFVHPTTRAWSILRTDPKGQSCLVDLGHGFQVVPAAPKQTRKETGA